MESVIVSAKGQIVLPIAVRKSLGLKPGMRVHVKVQGKAAVVTLAPLKNTGSLKDIQKLLKYEGPVVSIESMRVTDYKS